MKKTGATTGGIETSKRYRKRQAAQRRAQEQAWEEKSGPVLLRIGEHEIYVTSKARQDIARARQLLLDAIAAGAPPGVVRPRS